jgi:hypothetical protein
MMSTIAAAEVGNSTWNIDPAHTVAESPGTGRR